jgi:hypothetical protein
MVYTLLIMANKMKTSIVTMIPKKYCRKPMTLEMKAELMKLSDGM